MDASEQTVLENKLQVVMVLEDGPARVTSTANADLSARRLPGNVVKAMLEPGYVERVPGNARYVRLTEAGRKFAASNVEVANKLRQEQSRNGSLPDC